MLPLCGVLLQLRNLQRCMLLSLGLALAVALRLLLAWRSRRLSNQAAELVQLRVLSIVSALHSAFRASFRSWRLLARGSLRNRIRTPDYQLALVRHSLLVQLRERQSNALIMASLIPVEVLDQHRILQVLLLHLSSHLLLGSSVQQLDLLLLISVWPACLSPIRRLLMARCHNCALVRLALALLRRSGCSCSRRVALAYSLKAVGVTVSLLDGGLPRSLRPARVLLPFEPVALPDDLRADLLELAGSIYHQLRLVRYKLLMMTAGAAQIRGESATIMQ